MSYIASRAAGVPSIEVSEAQKKKKQKKELQKANKQKEKVEKEKLSAVVERVKKGSVYWTQNYL